MKITRVCSHVFFLVPSVRLRAAPKSPEAEALKREAVAEILDRMQTFTQQMVDQIFSYSGWDLARSRPQIRTGRWENRFRSGGAWPNPTRGWPVRGGKPVIASHHRLDGIQRLRKKRGSPTRDHSRGRAATARGTNGAGRERNAALPLQKMLDKHKLPGTIKIFTRSRPQSAPATKLFSSGRYLQGSGHRPRLARLQRVRDHGESKVGAGLVSVQDTFQGSLARRVGSGRARARSSRELMNARVEHEARAPALQTARIRHHNGGISRTSSAGGCGMVLLPRARYPRIRQP